MRDVTVLITACGNVYMPGTAASIKNNGERNVRLIGADMNHDDTILQMFDQYYQVPRGDDPSYADAILDICVKEKVDVVIPIMSVELETLAKNADRFAAAGVALSVSDLEPLKIANDKLALLKFMEANGIPTARFCEVNCVADVDEALEAYRYFDAVFSGEEIINKEDIPVRADFAVIYKYFKKIFPYGGGTVSIKRIARECGVSYIKILCILRAFFEGDIIKYDRISDFDFRVTILPTEGKSDLTKTEIMKVISAKNK
jgi:hypothetical protein